MKSEQRDIEDERAHGGARGVEESQLSITKTIAMASATVAIGIFLMELLGGNVSYGAPGSAHRTACMTSLLAALGAWAWSWVHSPPVGPPPQWRRLLERGWHASKQERHAQSAWILFGAHALIVITG